MRILVTALALSAAAGAASAQGIELDGDARLGLGYNINNDGDVALVESTDADGNVTFSADDDVRAVSRVRFGVNMTGVTESGIAFGAEIRADNAKGGNNSEGQTEGSVFVSGTWGTLSFGDVDGADYRHVGDVNENLSLTGLGDFNETPFISNGGGFGNDQIQFANDPEALPTVRYDYNFGAFGVSVSTDRDLQDLGFGAGYTFEFDRGSVNAGVGYYDFQAFTSRTSTGAEVPVDGGEQFSAGLTGKFEVFSAGIVYTDADASGSGTLETLDFGVGATLGVWGISTYYAKVLSSGGSGNDGNNALEVFDGADSYGASASYDLGGGAAVRGGIAKTFGHDAYREPGEPGYIGEVEATTVADFGIYMEF